MGYFYFWLAIVTLSPHSTGITNFTNFIVLVDSIRRYLFVFFSTCYQCDFLYLVLIGWTCFLNKPFLYLGRYFVSSFSFLLSFILPVSLFLFMVACGKGSRWRRGLVGGRVVGWLLFLYFSFLTYVTMRLEWLMGY